MSDLLRIQWPARWQEAPPSGFIGRALNAWLYGALARIDEVAATRLHDEQGAKPFTVALVREHQDDRLYLVVTACGELTETVSRLADTVSERLLLDASWLELEAPIIETNTWAGLASRVLLTSSRAVPVRIHFRSPTTFHSLGRTLPLPVPSLVFGGLLSRWQQWSPLDLGAAAAATVADHAAIARHHIRASVLQMEGRQPAFQGWADFTLSRPPQGYGGLLALLGLFAEFAGAGQKTAMGFGNVRAQPRWPANPPAAS